MSNAVVAGIDVTKFDDAAAIARDAKFFCNLDSELFMVPFGLGILFRDKLHNDLGAVYLELCMINSWSLGVGAGQTMVMENVTILFDRARPITAAGAGGASADNRANYDPASPSSSTIFQAIFQGNVNDLPAAVGGEDTVNNNPGGTTP